MKEEEKITQAVIDTKYISIEMSQLEPNEGQLDGLPANPREIKKEKLELLKENIQKYPEMLKLRGLIVYPLEYRKYIIIGGNMRYQAMSELGFSNAPCIVIPKDTSVEHLKAYTILDNNGFGKWDWDMLANEWDAKNLQSWGVDLPMWTDNDIEEPDGKLSTSLKDKDIAELRIKLDSETYASVVECLETFDEDLSVAIVKALGV